MLGKQVKDKITGFEGIAIGVINYLFGCNQIGIAPPMDKEGKRPPVEWFDEGRCEIIGDGIEPASVQTDKPGSEYNDHP
ncbi:MAG TPA: hypothetical protein VHL77_02125 [Ferruginibacter sp.]|jgi:hypothetical protein|nr:hypothetical protein [Ferruginibacter sp.]